MLLQRAFQMVLHQPLMRLQMKSLLQVPSLQTTGPTKYLAIQLAHKEMLLSVMKLLSMVQ